MPSTGPHSGGPGPSGPGHHRSAGKYLLGNQASVRVAHGQGTTSCSKACQALATEGKHWLEMLNYSLSSSLLVLESSILVF